VAAVAEHEATQAFPWAEKDGDDLDRDVRDPQAVGKVDGNEVFWDAFKEKREGKIEKSAENEPTERAKIPTK